MMNIIEQIINITVPIATYILFIFNYIKLNTKQLLIILLSIISIIYILTTYSNQFIAYLDYLYLQPGFPRLIMQIGRQILKVIDYFKPPVFEAVPEPLYDVKFTDIIYLAALFIYNNNQSALFLIMFLPSLYCVLSTNDNPDNMTDNIIKLVLTSLVLDGD